MKPVFKILFGVILITGVGLGLGGCVSDGYVRGGVVYYGPDPGPWFNDGPWFYGHRDYHYPSGAYIHPPRFHSPHPRGNVRPPNQRPNSGGRPNPGSRGSDRHDRDHH